MQASHTLWEYAEYTSRVRKYAKRLPVSEAVEQAITECINKGILKEFLEKNRAEAKNVSIYEYDQDKHIRQEREAAWEKGKKEGLAEGERAGEIKKMKDLIQKKLAKQKSPAAIAAELEENESVILQLIDELEHSDLAK